MVNTTKKLTTLYSLVFIFSMALLAGCGGGSGSSSSGSLELIEDYTGYISGAVNGYEENIFLAQRSYYSSDRDQFLYAYRQDSASPELLVEEDSVYLDLDNEFTSAKRMNVNSEWTATVLQYAYTPAGETKEIESYITLVSTERPNDGRALELFSAIPDVDIIDTVAYNGLLLIASDTELAVFNISDVSSPLLEGSYTINNTFSSLVAVPGGFYAFHSNGLTYVNCSDIDNITFTEIVDEDIKKAQRAWLVGNDLYIGGPSKYTDMSKIVKLDISNPSSPQILYIDDQIDGVARDFAYDTASRKFYVALKSLDNKDIILGYTESTNGFSQINSFQLTHRVDSFYVWNGFFYIDDYDMSVYKLQ